MFDCNGIIHKCRILLDCASQSSFISPLFAKKLALPLKNVNVTITGVGSAYSNHRVNLRITSLQSKYNISLSCPGLRTRPEPGTRNLRNRHVSGNPNQNQNPSFRNTGTRTGTGTGSGTDRNLDRTGFRMGSHLIIICKLARVEKGHGG